MDINQIKAITSSLPPWILLGAGFLTGWLKSFWNFFYDHTIGWASNKCKIELVIEEQDHLEAFTWLNLWMEKNLSKRRISKLRVQRRSKINDDEEKDNSFDFLPSYGFYWFWWRRKLLTFYSEKKDAPAGGGGYDNKKLLRTITLEIWGTRDRNLLTDVLLEAKKEFEVVSPKSMKFYVHESDYWNSYWMSERPLDTVYIPETLLDNMLKDIEVFFNSKETYKALGIPWRRGYSFEGPPGSGKSTLVQALSSHFKIPIYYLNAGKLSESTARELLFTVQSPCIILMEDIDSLEAAQKRVEDPKKKKDGSPLGLKPSELLNLLDGVIATEQRIVIMTTNHPEKLDAAVLRAGRVDRRFKINFAEDTELKKFYDKAKEHYDLPEFSVFRKSLPEKCTIADAQSKIFELQSDIKDLT